MAERVGWRSSSANPSGIFRSATDLILALRKLTLQIGYELLGVS